jgi:hypothetical protein
MTSITRLITILSLLSTLIVYTPVASASLPTAYEAKLKLATKVDFGQEVPLALANCKSVKVKSKLTWRCTYEKLMVTVNSFKFYDRSPIYGDTFDYPKGEQFRYSIDVKMENYSSNETGLLVGDLLRCKSSGSQSSSPFWADGLNPQFVPPKSQDSGVIISSFPEEVSADKCESPIILLSPTSWAVNLNDKKEMKEVKKKKLLGMAYIPLTPQMLAAQ